MSALRKVTMNIPADLLDGLPEQSGQTMTGAIVTALRDYRQRLASRRLLDAQGKVKFESTWQELRGKYDDE